MSGYFYDENGRPYGVKHVSGKPRTSSMPYLYDIAEGNVASHHPVEANGYNTDVDLASEETIWPAGGLRTFSDASQCKLDCDDDNDKGTERCNGTADAGSGLTTLIDAGSDFVTATVTAGDLVVNDTKGEWGYVVSRDSATQLTVTSMANEMGAGTGFAAGNTFRVIYAALTGASCVLIVGLDTNWGIVREFVKTNGVTAVTMTASLLRINYMRVLHTGAGLKNIGRIFVTNNGVTVDLNQIPLGRNSSQSAFFSVPAGYVFYMTRWSLGEINGNRLIGRLYSSQYQTGANNLMVLNSQIGVFSGSVTVPFDVPLRFGPKTDVEIRGQGDQDNCYALARFEGWYEAL